MKQEGKYTQKHIQRKCYQWKGKCLKGKNFDLSHNYTKKKVYLKTKMIGN